MIDKHCKECEQKLSEFEIATAIDVCAECRFKATEEKHGSAQAELDRIREKARERRWKFMEKSKAEGKRQFSAIISKEAYNIMAGIRDTAQLAGKPTSFGEIIEKALVCYNETISKSSSGITIVSSHETTNQDKSEPEPDQEPKFDTVSDLPEPQEPAPKLPTVGNLSEPEPTEKKVTESPLDLFSKDEPKPDQATEIHTEIPAPAPEKASILERMAKYRAAGDSWPVVADKLNDQGITTARGSAWSKANAQTFYSRNKKA